MFSKQFTANNLASILIGLVTALVVHLTGADNATAAAFAVVLTFIAHHYFHLDVTAPATGIGDNGNAGSSASGSSPGTSTSTGTTVTTTNSTSGPTAPAPVGS